MFFRSGDAVVESKKEKVMKSKLLNSLNKAQMRTVAQGLGIQKPEKMNKEKLILELSKYPYKNIAELIP
jgi:hypothetical protein